MAALNTSSGGNQPARLWSGTDPSLGDNGEASFSAQDIGNRPVLADREYDDRYMVFSSKRKGSGVHDSEIALNGFLMRQPIIAFRIAVLFRVRTVDPVNIGCLQHRTGPHFSRPKYRRRVGREEWISGTGSKHEHSALLQITQRAFSFVDFA